MIPKKIHYCWFGRGEMPLLAQKCIASWKKYLPEYEIKEWNEDNFDLSLYPYAKQAYENRKYAFVTDVVRLYALYTEGGVYMDTDVEVVKPLDSILTFEAVSGFETSNQVPTGLIAAHKRSPIIGELLNDYNERSFISQNGEINLTTNVIYITNTLKKHGLILNNEFQTINGFSLLPWDYLCPKSVKDGKIYCTDNTLAIHHFAGSWHSPFRNKVRDIVLQLGGYRLKKFIRAILPKSVLKI